MAVKRVIRKGIFYCDIQILKVLRLYMQREKAARSAGTVSATMFIDESLIFKLPYYPC